MNNMRTGVTNILGMLALERVEPIFKAEVERLRQEGLYNGSYLIGVCELKITVNDNKILFENWRDIKYTIYEDRQFYESLLESQIGDEIIMGEQI